MSHALDAINEAVDPKRVLRSMREWRQSDYKREYRAKEGWVSETWTFKSGADLLQLEKCIEDPEIQPDLFYWRVAIKRSGWARWAVMPNTRPVGAIGKVDGDAEYYLPFEAAKERAIKWAETKLVSPKPVGEAKMDPKTFFIKHRFQAQRSADVEEILSYMPDSFVQAYRNGKTDDWENPYEMDSDWWPSYDDDDAEEGDPWREYIYYFNYRTEGGKLFAVAMSGDKDGEHDFSDEAEVGTPEYPRLVKAYGSDGWIEAMIRYWQWVIAEGGKDPLGYVHVDTVPVKSKWVVGFVRDGERLKVWGLRNISDPPSPPAVKWPKLKQKAAEDPEWKKALEYLMVDEDGYLTAVTEENIVNDGGKWKGERLDLKFEWTDQDAAGNAQEQILGVARNALAEMEHMRQGRPNEGD